MIRFFPLNSTELTIDLACLIAAVFFLLTQHLTLRRIRRENRLMQPGLVWLQLIPLFANIWQFFVITRLAGSIRNELASRQEDPVFGPDALVAQGVIPMRPTQGIGIAYAVLDTLVILMSFGHNRSGQPNELFLLGVVSWGMLICWIIYWVKLGRYKNKLKRVLG